MTFQPNQPMSRAKAVLAIRIYKSMRGDQTFYSRNFSEPRRKSRKIKFWLQPCADRVLMAKMFEACHIPFYYAWDDSIAINVPLDVTLSNVSRSAAEHPIYFLR